MLVQACKTIRRLPLSLTLHRPVSTIHKLNTQVFKQLDYNTLANPRYAKALILKPIHNHSRMTQRFLYHRKRVSGKIVSCYSEKKHKVFRRVNKVRREMYSEVLGQRISVVLSKKAERTVKKMGSFDHYILCTKPKDLDSKYGQYLRQLMLRKINDQDFRVPYIIGTNRKLRIKSYSRHLYLQNLDKFTIPKQFKQQFRTFQPKFGKTVQQLNNEDYSKYLQLQDLQKKLGDQLEQTHPLLLQLKQKMNQSILTEEQERKLQLMAKEAEQKFVNHPKRGEANRKRVEKAKQKIQLMNARAREMKFKLQKDVSE